MLEYLIKNEIWGKKCDALIRDLVFLSRASRKSIQIQNQNQILISINNAIQYDSVYHIYYIITVKIRR